MASCKSFTPTHLVELANQVAFKFQTVGPPHHIGYNCGGFDREIDLSMEEGREVRCRAKQVLQSLYMYSVEQKKGS